MIDLVNNRKKIEHLQRLEQLLKDLKVETTTMRRAIKSIEDKLDDLQQQLTKNQRSIERFRG